MCSHTGDWSDSIPDCTGEKILNDCFRVIAKGPVGYLTMVLANYFSLEDPGISFPAGVRVAEFCLRTGRVSAGIGAFRARVADGVEPSASP